MTGLPADPAGTLFSSSAISNWGILHGDPLKLVVGIGILAVILLGAVLVIRRSR
jgi:hypothetical protein